MDDLVFLAFDLQGVQAACVELTFTLFHNSNNDVIAVDQGLICSSTSKGFISNGLDREEATFGLGDEFTGKIGSNMIFKHDGTSSVIVNLFYL